ncbi:hypothetical protein N0V84_007791 [Fusarium piperis]|uniref:NAD-dependent epimerase/dehydratase domain-containing protein n=1 Tax=Fusarium piperis TaxID=1435070 RepID=A0A9W8W9E8_9HYPO|nr:hypothetical protein N0V84_007791 [Fusarium piperis]
MSKQTVAITGGTGHIGFMVLVGALSAGYRVRAIVRKQDQIAKIQAPKAIQPYLSSLEPIVIPDLSAPAAFDALGEDIWGIIHIASPTFSGRATVNVGEFISTARRITQNVLDFAANTPSVKRVVVTSSISSVLPSLDSKPDPKTFFTSQSPISTELLESPPEEALDTFAYTLSKISVAQMVRDYVESSAPSFSLVSIMPGTTVGPNELAASPSDLLAGSNTVVLAPLLGYGFPPIPSIISHVDDVVYAHVKALTLEVPSGSMTSVLPVFNSKEDETPFEWDDAIRIAKERFPNAVKKGIFPCGGSVPVARFPADSTKDETLLDRKFKSYEQAVGDVISQYLELHSLVAS